MTEIDIKMSSIYRASKGALPLKAYAFAHQIEHMVSGVEAMVKEVSLAGEPGLGGVLGELAEELYLHLRNASRTMSDSAVALDKMADDFVRADGDAQAWMLKKENKMYEGGPWVPPIPSAPSF